ncbi:acyl-CoA dehydrogenase family protein [Streptomonospora litoralis]|uniref:Glutaryl-CoA dehydrogenase n=1 Tax=Streptomonospora litoralis TaxID=2498135 RepID=A0A4P6PWQ8_9ACTN|nr:acyl-CoA dehydrogenase family protein [Streptomonospora litoralis]QBI52618.1 Glutaryl-CoA dehydrogenase [Streptomonospora litoralis]
MTPHVTGTAAFVRALDDVLGHPYDPGNPLGHARLLAADEDARLLPEAVAVLGEYGIGAELVPAELGGRFDRLDRFARLLRRVCTRDVSLGFARAGTAFTAACDVWIGGTGGQRKALAQSLVAGGTMAGGYHEFAHGGDIGRTQCRAVPDGPGTLLLTGTKDLVANIAEADTVLVFARTGEAPGDRSHSQILVDARGAAAHTLRTVPRSATSGLRGVPLGGAVFTDLPLPRSAVVGGETGGGMETALRSFQLARIVGPAMMIGGAESGLRAAVRFALTRMLYGAPAADIPMVRAMLTESFADLLTCEAASTVAARTAHLRPERLSVPACALEPLASQILAGAMHRLSTVMGAHFYIRGGEHGVFEKQLRDTDALAFAHGGRAASQAALIPQLPLLAECSRPGEEPLRSVYALDAPLPPLDWGALSATAGGCDELTSALHLFGGGAGPRVAGLIDGFVDELAALRRTCSRIGPEQLTAGDAHLFDLADRYGTVLAAAACVGLWEHNRRGADAFTADPAWLEAALSRLAGRLGRGDPSLPDDVAQRLFGELRERCEQGRSLELTAGSVRR